MSFRSSTLLAVDLSEQNLEGTKLWDANISNSTLRDANLVETHLGGTNLSNVNLDSDTLQQAIFGKAVQQENTIYNQWTKFPEGFDPTEYEMDLVESEPGDFDADGNLDLDDLSAIVTRSTDASFRDWLPDAMFDSDGNHVFDRDDIQFWLTDIREALPGDTNLDDAIAFDDFLTLSDSYGQPGTWVDGDFDGDGEVRFPDFLALSASFGKTDLAAVTVPEPVSGVTFAIGLLLLLNGKVRRRGTNEPTTHR